MRPHIEQLLLELEGSPGIWVPTQDQIDRAEAVAMFAMGRRVDQQLNGMQVVIAALAIVKNLNWVLGMEQSS